MGMPPAALGLGLLMLAPTDLSAGAPQPCPEAPVRVAAPEGALADRICTASRDAVTAMETCGIALADEQAIEVVEPPLPMDCLGLYHCGEDRIELLSPADVADQRRPEGAFAAVPLERFYPSLILHELAHAAYDDRPCPLPNCIVTSEYIAYAMQIRSLPPEDRVDVERFVTREPPVSREELGMTTLLLSPDIFAAKVWAHFLARPDGCAYLRQMMAGDIILDRERP